MGGEYESREWIRESFPFMSEAEVERDFQRRQLRRQLTDRPGPEEPIVDLSHLQSFAFLIVRDDNGVCYQFQWGGVALAQGSVRGFLVPLPGDAASVLTRVGHQPHDRDGELDWGRFEPIVSEHLPGWEAATDLSPVHDEAFLWLRCDRQLTDAERQVEGNPFGNEWQERQGSLVGRLACLVWENSD